MRLHINQHVLAILCRLTALSACVICGFQAQGQVPTPSPSQLVKLTLIATNPAGNSVEDVSREDLQVFEDKLPRTISLFSKDLRPVDYALVIDSSGSFRSLIAQVVGASKSLVSSKHPDEEVFIESFVSSDSITKVQDFTADQTKLIAALESLFVKGGQSAVIDAIFMAIKHTVEVKGAVAGRRRSVVLFTDGEDRSSYYGTDELVKLIRENDLQLFVVGIVGLLDNEGGSFRRNPRDKAEQLLSKIAEESGGRVFFPKGVDELLQATTQIAHDLHFQYSIGFERESKPGEKGFQKIKVKFSDAPGREKFKVFTRPGFLMTSPEPPSKAKEMKSP